MRAMKATARLVLAVFAVLAFAVSLVAASACGGKKPPVVVEPPEDDAGTTSELVDAAAPAPKSLWERLGGKDAVGAVVDELLVNALADNRINKFFEKVKKDDAKKKQLRDVLVAFICEKTGGTDCGYTSTKSMKDVHKDMKLTEAHWNAFVEDLKIALASKSVSDDLQTELLGELAKTKPDIVTPKK
jgi:hemoglobin